MRKASRRHGITQYTTVRRVSDYLYVLRYMYIRVYVLGERGAWRMVGGPPPPFSGGGGIDR